MHSIILFIIRKTQEEDENTEGAKEMQEESNSNAGENEEEVEHNDEECEGANFSDQ